MITTQALVNRFGDSWNVEFNESERLTHLGGFLMTYGTESCIMLSAWLTPSDKARGREFMLNRLAVMPVGISGTYLWSPADEGGHHKLGADYPLFTQHAKNDG